MAITTIIIGKGPARGDLVDALKYAFDKWNPHVVVFTTDKNETLKVRIISLTHEDGSGYKFNFRGFCTGIACQGVIQGFYDSNTQKGNFDL